MENKLELTVLEKARLSESIASLADQRHVSESELRLVAERCAPQKADVLYACLDGQRKTWNSASIRNKVWKYYRLRLLPRFKSLRQGDSCDFSRVSQDSLSPIWVPSLCLLALWKFDYEEHRTSIHSSTAAWSCADLEGYAELRPTMVDIWTRGREWLDEVARNNGYRLPNLGLPGQREDNDECNVNEQAMYLFVRSHLAWENQKLVRAMPARAVQNLLDARLENGLWPDLTPSDGKLSFQATGMALAALGDWEEYLSIAMNSTLGYDRWQVASGAEHEIEQHATYLNSIRQACADGLEKVLEYQFPDGSWPRDGDAVSQNEKGDLRATSMILYSLDRFAHDYSLRVPCRLLLKAEDWILGEVTERAKSSTSENRAHNYEQTALAVSALARRMHPTHTLWLRSATQYLLEGLDGCALPSPSESIDSPEAWRVYGIIEIIRRATCDRYLDRPL